MRTSQNLIEIHNCVFLSNLTNKLLDYKKEKIVILI
jgi:hypothetical protein